MARLAPQKNRIHARIGIVLATVALVGLGLVPAVRAKERAAGPAEATPERLVGRMAPDFPTKPGYGLSVPRLSSLQGKVVLLDFWATWCRPCLRALADLQDLQEKLGKAGFTVVGISADSPMEVAGILADKGASYPQVFDRGGRIAARYAVTAFPTLVLIGRDGRVKRISLGGLEPILIALTTMLK